MRHERFGRDFTGDPLIPAWDDDTRLVLLGHSFGGATVRLFSELLADGDAAEREAAGSEGLSPLFAGGMAGRIHAIITLSSSMNGTTAYDLFEDPSFNPKAIHMPFRARIAALALPLAVTPKRDGRDPRDYADYDMHVARALELNARISTLPHVYYISVPCSTTVALPDGTHVAKRQTEPLFLQRAFPAAPSTPPGARTTAWSTPSPRRPRSASLPRLSIVPLSSRAYGTWCPPSRATTCGCRAA